jgi:hypothetical protein
MDLLTAGLGLSPYALVTAGLESGPAQQGGSGPSQLLTGSLGFSPYTLVLRGLGGSGSPPSTYIFDTQLATYLSAQLGYLVRPLYYPQQVALPAMTYTLTTKRRLHVLRGSSGQATSTYQFTCWANDYLTTATMAENLFDVLDGFAGTMGTATVQAALAEEEVALWNPPVNDGRLGVHQRVCTYQITHLEPVSNPTAARN